MATHGPQSPGSGVTQLPGVVPFDLANLTRLSWELGSRVIDDAEATCRGEWTHSGSPWTISVFDVTSETVAVRVRTPTGRERFYGAARMDIEAALPALETATDWRPRD